MEVFCTGEESKFIRKFCNNLHY